MQRCIYYNCTCISSLHPAITIDWPWSSARYYPGGQSGFRLVGPLALKGVKGRPLVPVGTRTTEDGCPCHPAEAASTLVSTRLRTAGRVVSSRLNGAPAKTNHEFSERVRIPT